MRDGIDLIIFYEQIYEYSFAYIKGAYHLLAHAKSARRSDFMRASAVSTLLYGSVKKISSANTKRFITIIFAISFRI